MTLYTPNKTYKILSEVKRLKFVLIFLLAISFNFSSAQTNGLYITNGVEVVGLSNVHFATTNVTNTRDIVLNTNDNAYWLQIKNAHQTILNATSSKKENKVNSSLTISSYPFKSNRTFYTTNSVAGLVLNPTTEYTTHAKCSFKSLMQMFTVGVLPTSVLNSYVIAQTQDFKNPLLVTTFSTRPPPQKHFVA